MNCNNYTELNKFKGMQKEIISVLYCNVEKARKKTLPEKWRLF